MDFGARDVCKVNEAADAKEGERFDAVGADGDALRKNDGDDRGVEDDGGEREKEDGGLRAALREEGGGKDEERRKRQRKNAEGAAGESELARFVCGMAGHARVC